MTTVKACFDADAIGFRPQSTPKFCYTLPQDPIKKGREAEKEKAMANWRGFVTCYGITITKSEKKAA